MRTIPEGSTCSRKRRMNSTASTWIELNDGRITPTMTRAGGMNWEATLPEQVGLVVTSGRLEFRHIIKKSLPKGGIGTRRTPLL